VTSVIDCIFVIKPHECQLCIESRLLGCVTRKTHLMLTEDGKARTRAALHRVLEDPERVKAVPGNSQRAGV